MPMIESIAIALMIVGFLAASGSSGSEKRRKPYVPIFSSTLARTTEPAVGASVCASGSQVWNGNIGTFTAKPRKNAQKTHHCTSPEADVRIRSAISKLVRLELAVVLEVQRQDAEQHQHASRSSV